MNAKRGIVLAMNIAALLNLAAATAATAAEGTLTINGTDYADPSGCYHVGEQQMLQIANHTNETVTVYRAAHCSRDPVGTVSPRGTGAVDGSSVSIP
jgi:hypothetical protein